jgi:hypothetical protein
MLNLDQDVRHQQRWRQMPGQGPAVESAVVVVLARIEQKEIGQLLLGDEAFEVAHVSVSEARRANPVP